LASLPPLARELGAEGLNLLLADIAESRAVVARAVSERRYTAPVVLDTDGRVTRAYGVRATPTVFVIDRAGRSSVGRSALTPGPSPRGGLS
jgi:hypothetical protein